MNKIDTIKTYLDEIANLTFTESTANYNWKSILEDVIRTEEFYLSEGAWQRGGCERERAAERARGREAH